jgi:hypothetical protein
MVTESDGIRLAYLSAGCLPKEVLMSKGLTRKLPLLVLLGAVALGLASCAAARTHLTPAERAGVPGDEYPAASPGFSMPSPPSESQAP